MGGPEAVMQLSGKTAIEFAECFIVHSSTEPTIKTGHYPFRALSLKQMITLRG